MDRLIAKLYGFIPKPIIDILGKSKSFKNVRDYFLRNNGRLKITKTRVRRAYLPFKVDFKFNATIKTAVKAKKQGIENALLQSSLTLLADYNSIKNPIIFDVGASYGYLSLVWAQTLLADGGTLYAFEPSPAVANVMEENIKCNALDAKITLVKCAVGNKNDQIELFDSAITSNVITYPGATPITVDMVSLDQFISNEKIENVSLIKIDVDGLEFEILEGSKTLLKNFMPILILETNDDPRIIDLCSSLGYVLFDENLKPLATNQKIPANIFCVDLTKYKVHTAA